jgi:predicted dehydrogenase/threonine dehydrogenase-like Zn-dependent dehydrogenase
MKQVIARAGKVVVAEVPSPTPDENSLLVKTSYSVISTGTETWTIDSTDPLSPSDIVKSSSVAKKAVKLSREVVTGEGMKGFMDYVDYVRHPEVALGYSLSGTVVSVGRKVRDMTVGDKVACAGEGKASHAEFVSVPRNLVAKVPDGVEMQHAAFATIGSIALHAFRRSGSQVGDAVGVIGAGLVGNVVAQIARASGCRVVSLDVRDDRLQLAKEVGVDLCLRSDDSSLLQHISHFTNGRGLDSVFICAATSSSDPINLAASMARGKAKVVVVGRVGMNLERKDFYQKELDLVMTRSLGPGRYDPTYEDKGVDYPVEHVRWTLNRNMEGFLELLRTGRVKLNKLIGAEYAVERADEAYAFLNGQSKVAVLLKYEESTVEPSPVVVVGGNGGSSKPTEAEEKGAAKFPPVAGKINVALVGPGNFAKEMLMPLLRRSPDYNLRWVVSSNPVNATRVQKRYGFEKSTCDYEDVLKDPETNLIVISTPNNMHYRMVMDAIEAHKAVFVEKPLCVTRQEFEDIKNAELKHRVPLVVGFNRRYSPLVLKVKDKMSKMDGPFLITLRVNAGFVPASRWIQDPALSGGRIIHECCHFFDLFDFMLDQSGPEIQVQTAGVNGSTTVARDNVSVTLKYPDGSIASLIYTALGGKSMDRERLEVFGQGTSMVIEDFKELKTFGQVPTRTTLKGQEKGHAPEFNELSKLLHGNKSTTISTDEVFAAMELTFRVDEALRDPLSN